MALLKFTESQKEGGIKWGAGFLFFLIGWGLLAQPGIQKVALIKKKNEEAKIRSRLAGEIRGLRKEYGKLNEFLLPRGDRHRFLGKVTTLTKASGLEIVSLAPSEEPGESYVRSILNLNVRAPFPSLVQFLNQLEEIKPLILVPSLKISSLSGREPGSQAGGRVEASLTLESYMKKETP